MEQKPRRRRQSNPDSLPEQNGDQPQSPPDSLPPAADRNTADGGTDQHPIHDDDLEDRDPEDFEHDIDDMDDVEELDVVLRRRG